MNMHHLAAAYVQHQIEQHPPETIERQGARPGVRLFTYSEADLRQLLHNAYTAGFSRLDIEHDREAMLAGPALPQLVEARVRDQAARRTESHCPPGQRLGPPDLVKPPQLFHATVPKQSPLGAAVEKARGWPDPAVLAYLLEGRTP